MKYLKLFESEENILSDLVTEAKKVPKFISEIKEMFYILEDEGYRPVLNRIVPRSINASHNMAKSLEITNKYPKTYRLIIMYAPTEINDTITEFTDRALEICNKNNYNFKKTSKKYNFMFDIYPINFTDDYRLEFQNQISGL